MNRRVLFESEGPDMMPIYMCISTTEDYEHGKYKPNRSRTTVDYRATLRTISDYD